MLATKEIYKLIYKIGFLVLFCFGCSDVELHPDDVEYRVDENGTELLYQIGMDYPFGYGENAYIVDYFPNKQKKFKIEFLNGKKHGVFTFWQDNGLPVLTGSFESGKKDGLFTAYGKIGELIYEKNYSKGELNGIFKLYYPCSKSEVSKYYDDFDDSEGDSDGLFDRLTSWVSNNADYSKSNISKILRLDANFSNDKPHGSYKIFYHPKGNQLTLDELIQEQGRFENGKLVDNQTSYYPRTFALIVILPNGKKLDQNYPPDANGFSHAIDDANKEYSKVPSYRNPKDLPALVYTIDDKGERIAPIWSSHISEIRLRRSDGTLLDKSFKANYEDFIKAMEYASDNYSYGGDIKFTEESPAIRGKNVLEVVGINLKGDKIVVVDILWSSNELSENVSLNKRINKKRIKIRRKWSEGITNETIWSLTTGSKIRMLDNSFSALASLTEE